MARIKGGMNAKKKPCATYGNALRQFCDIGHMAL